MSSLGTPIGKTKLFDLDDGTKDAFVPFPKVLGSVKRVCHLAHQFETRIIRGFIFYPPKSDDSKEQILRVVERMCRIAEVCESEEVVYAAEVEARLLGRNGHLLSEIHRRVNHPAFFTCLDLGNLHSQGYSTGEVLEQTKALIPSIGLFHIKDYSEPMPDKVGEIDEDALKHFVPADEGDGGHTAVMQVLKGHLPAIDEKLKAQGVPGLFCDMEPHLKGGGQFGGFSGPDGMGVALRAFCRVCDSVGVGYKLRDFDDVKRVRGY